MTRPSRPGLTNDADVRSLASNTLLRLFDSLYEGAVVVDRAGRITWINDKYKALLGLNGTEPVEGRAVEEIIPNSRLRHVMESGRAELLDVFAIGSRQVVVSRIPLQDESGTVIGGLGVILYDRVQALKPIVSKFQQMQSDLASARRELAGTRQAKYRFSQMVGISPRLREVKDQARRAAERDATVLLLGETGTGKELMAHAIHGASRRADKPLVSLNAAAIPETLLEAELFGVEPGAFTGAAAKPRPGKFQIADGGTLFLDEVADLPLSMQVKLLRAIQEKSVRPVGSAAEEPVDTRIISASHKNLSDMVANGEFRQDLFYRIHVIELPMSPLRSRREDIPVMIDHILSRLSQRTGMPKPHVDRDALKTLYEHDFPGNVRELENILERATALCENDTICAEDLGLDRTPDVAALQAVVGLPAEGLEDYLAGIERQVIVQALEATRWNRTAAARALGISFRALRYRLEKLGLDTDEPPVDADRQ